MVAKIADPTVKREILQTTTDTTNIRIDISEMIDFLSPFETPFLNMVGRDSLRDPCTQVKHEWMSDQDNPRAGTLASAYTAGSHVLTLTSGQAKYLFVDDLILVDNIVFQVVTLPTTGDVIVVRLIAGTDAAIASGAEWRLLSHAAPEAGSARAEQKKTVIARTYNYTQILKDYAIISGTMDVIKRYGYVSERAYQEQKILRKQAMDLEQSLLYGVMSYEEGPPRRSTMGGLFHYVFLDGITNSWDTIVNASGAAFDEKMLNDELQTMWELGAMPNFIMVNGTNKRRISSWGKPFIRTERGERTFGASIGVYESDFGMLDIVLNRNLRPSDIVIGDASQIGIGPLEGRQFTSRELPATIDGRWFEVLGEMTMEVHRPNVDFGWIYNTDVVY